MAAQMREATIEELLADPMMELVYQHSRMTECQTRELVAEVSARVLRDKRASDATIQLRIVMYSSPHHVSP
jgi:hypothetical protein